MVEVFKTRRSNASCFFIVAQLRLIYSKNSMSLEKDSENCKDGYVFIVFKISSSSAVAVQMTESLAP